MVKSLRSTGQRDAPRARPGGRRPCRRSTGASVSTLSAAAPPALVLLGACAAGSRSGARSPFDGDRRLISAITASVAVGAPERAGEVAGRRRVERGLAEQVPGLRPVQHRDLVALRREDLVEDRHSDRRVYGPDRHRAEIYAPPMTITFPTGSSGAPRPRPTRSRAATGTTTGGRSSTPRLRARSRSSGDACDHFYRYPDDIAMLARPRLRRLPLLARVVAHRARGGRVLHARARPLPPHARDVPRARPAPRRHVPPLHDAALAGRRRRLGRPRDRRPASPASASGRSPTSAT